MDHKGNQALSQANVNAHNAETRKVGRPLCADRACTQIKHHHSWMKKSTPIAQLMELSEVPRRMLMNDCIRHSTAECNGDYYYNDDNNTWEGDLAQRGKRLDKSIDKRLKEFFYPHEVPVFLSSHGDPRGFTLKLITEKMTDDEKQECRDFHLMTDWGGDYAIITDNESKS